MIKISQKYSRTKQIHDCKHQKRQQHIFSYINTCYMSFPVLSCWIHFCHFQVDSGCRQKSRGGCRRPPYLSQNVIFVIKAMWYVSHSFLGWLNSFPASKWILRCLLLNRRPPKRMLEGIYWGFYSHFLRYRPQFSQIRHIRVNLSKSRVKVIETTLNMSKIY